MVDPKKSKFSLKRSAADTTAVCSSSKIARVTAFGDADAGAVFGGPAFGVAGSGTGIFERFFENNAEQTELPVSDSE